MLEFNGKQLKLEIDYNTMCELEEMGVSIMEIESKTLSTIRALLYIALKKTEPNITIEQAGKQISEYFANGGTIEKLGEAFEKAVSNSGFFPKNNK